MILHFISDLKLNILVTYCSVHIVEALDAEIDSVSNEKDFVGKDFIDLRPCQKYLKHYL